MKVVYVVLENWAIDSGEKGTEVSVYSSFELAYKELLRLKENYEIDFETNERRLKDKVYEETETLDFENKVAEILVSFKDSVDSYELQVLENVVDYNLEVE